MFSMNIRDSLDFSAVENSIRAMDKAIQMKLARFMQERARYYAPVDTGFLRDNIVIEDDGDITRVVSLAPYSHFQEFGWYGARHKATGRFSPQEHWPDKMKWPSRIGGDRLRAQYVYYGPSKESTAPKWHGPHPFMRPALQDTLEAFPNIARASWLEVEANPKNSELGVHASQHSGSSFGGAGGGLISALGVGFD